LRPLGKTGFQEFTELRFRVLNGPGVHGLPKTNQLDD
jgi:hypothetical protein